MAVKINRCENEAHEGLPTNQVFKMTSGKKFCYPCIEKAEAEQKANGITVEVNYEDRTVLRAEYIKAKTMSLKAFGYTTLTEDEVAEQLEKILTGAPEAELNVIGQFVLGDKPRKVA